MKMMILMAILLLFAACAPRSIDMQYRIVDNPCAKFINIGDHDLCMYEFYNGAAL